MSALVATCGHAVERAKRSSFSPAGTPSGRPETRKLYAHGSPVLPADRVCLLPLLDYLMLPIEMPSIKDLWNSRKSTITGSTTSVDAAMSRLNCTS